MGKSSEEAPVVSLSALLHCPTGTIHFNLSGLREEDGVSLLLLAWRPAVVAVLSATGP